MCGDLTIEVAGWHRDPATGDIVFDAGRDGMWEAFLERLLARASG